MEFHFKLKHLLKNKYTNENHDVVDVSLAVDDKFLHLKKSRKNSFPL